MSKLTKTQAQVKVDQILDWLTELEMKAADLLVENLMTGKLQGNKPLTDIASQIRLRQIEFQLFHSMMEDQD